MTEEDALQELARLDVAAAMTDDERRHFENTLILRAYVRGWTGDPLCQPAVDVLAAYRQMRSERDEARSARSSYVGERPACCDICARDQPRTAMVDGLRICDDCFYRLRDRPKG